MDPPLALDAPRETQTIRVPPADIQAYRDWALEGTGLTAAARVTDSAGRIALVKNSWSNGWIVPGGAVEPGEDLAAAAKREVREETGLEAAIHDCILVINQTYISRADPATQVSTQFVVFDAAATGTISDPAQLGVEAGEIRAAQWFRTLPDNLHDDELFRPYLRE
ncbi:NUDIX hydrolase [Natronolimnobius baerhuensis]|uniref:NUDIX hydrolase n=1 Tax=Natronolimnobius baerhuensis TaxID=253108 RepID=A0A202ECV9_9EURY|nr:NUDIX hydrolase [Natronolimnobius baerhuensis]OVE86055.1 NUDIX hydrolase [Natronolimnobius baerhuensis]